MILGISLLPAINWRIACTAARALSSFDYSVAVGDFNGDGKPDFVATNVNTNSVSVFLNTTATGASTPAFSAKTDFGIGIRPQSVSVCDFNNDGKQDIVTTNNGGYGATVILNTTITGASTPSFSAVTNLETSSAPQQIRTSDLNNDGKPDITAACFNGDVISVLLNTTTPGASTPTFTTTQNFSAGTHIASVSVCDFNGDGKADLAATNSFGTVSILMNTMTLGVTAPSLSGVTTFSSYSNPAGITNADFNGDGKPDMAFADYGFNSIIVYLNTTTPGASAPAFGGGITITGISGAYLVLSADFNGDGKLDIAVSNSSASMISVYLNTTTPGASTPTFSGKTDFSFGSTPYYFAIGDFNGDGKKDIAAANYGSNTISVLLNTTTPGASTATFSAKTDFTSGANPYDVVIADINGDGKSDIIESNDGANTVSVLLNTTTPGASTPTFSAKTDFAAGLRPQSILHISFKNKISPMSKIISIICVVAVLVLSTNGAKAQVNVTPNSVNYTTLKAAFNAINAGTHTGAITISISGNTTETDSCVINATGVGAASYSSITMSPTGGAARTIQGNVNGNFIVFNGADNFTINGLNTGGNSLTISNSSASTLASTIRYFDDASNNTITNCIIKGSGISNLIGTVWFSIGTTTGNENNVISNSDIGPEGLNLPTCAVYSAGTSGTILNDNNTISGCNIFDFFNASSISYAVQLTGTGNSNWNIQNNKFYQTGARTYTAGFQHVVISIGTGVGYVVTGNTIGYASNSGTGAYTMLGANTTRFLGITGAFLTGTTSRISNNIFRSFLLSTNSGTASVDGIWCAIRVTSGPVNIDSNSIGDGASNNSITVISALGGIAAPINSQTTSGNVSIQGNSIGSITCKGTTALVGSGFTGINVTSGGTGFNLTLANNLIGSNTQANSIYCSDTLAAPSGTRGVTGISVVAGWTGNVRIANNTVRNMTSGSSAFRNTGTGSSTIGILCASVGSATGAVSIDSNSVRDINVYQTLTTTSTSTTTGAGNLGYGMIFNNSTGLSLNYNNIFTPGANGCVARNTTLTTDYNSLTAWRTANPTFDALTFSTDPLYLNPSAATPDLHLQDPNPQSRAGGTNASVLVDFDGNTRPSTAGQRPDIGADEANFTATPNNMDYQAPAITFNTNLPLLNALATGARTLSGFAKIMDNGTLGSGANAPRIYYRRVGIDPDNFTACFSGGNNSGGATGWRYTTATGNTGDDFDFNMDFTLLNGGSVSSGNQIAWFIAAQDLSTVTSLENYFTNQTGGIATVSPALNNLTTPFGTSTANYLFNISSAFSGVVTVGTGGTYGNLTGASGLFNAINTSAVTGNVYVSVLSNLVEPGTVGLNTFSAPHNIQIRPSGSATTRIIEGTTVGTGLPLIDLIGADRVNFNGADSATNTGQYFRFINDNATAANTGPVFRFTNDTRQDSIRNCIIESNATTLANAMVLIGTTTNSAGNDSIFVDNCLFKQSAGTNAGRYFTAYSSTGSGSGAQRNSDNFITNCNFTGMLGTSTVVLSISGTGNGDNWTISGNKFYNDIVFTVINGVIKINNTSATNVTVSNNSIGGSNPDRSGTFWGASTGVAQTGLLLAVGTTAASNVYNNTIGNWGNNGIGLTSSANCIDVTAGKVNIGSLGGNTLGGLANPWDSLRSEADNGFITASSSDTTKIENNLIGNAFYRSGSTQSLRGIYAATGVNIIRNNTIRDLTGNSTSTGNSLFTVMGMLIIPSTSGQIIEGNTIYNLQNNNTASGAFLTTAIHFGVPTGLSTVARNRIYNITSLGTGTGANAPVNCAIINSSTAVLNIINNQISLSASTLEPVLLGINNVSTGSMTLLYNSIYIGGICANAANTSYCYNRQSTSNDTVRNNLFFNQRTGGANNYCVRVGSSVNWTSKTANYNAYFPSTANQVGIFVGFNQQTFDNWKTNSSGDASSVSATGVSSANLFTSTSTGNLNIIGTNAESWNVAGLGTPVTSPQVLNDYGTSSTVRSVTIAGGVTDIGSDEFTPAIAPSPVTASGPPANNTTTTYTYNGRVLGSIDWGAGGTVPTGITFTYFPGVNPPGSIGFPTSNGYWLINATGGSGYSYDITINYDDAVIGEITSESDIRLSKSEDGGATWNTFTVTGTAAGQYELNTNNNTIKYPVLIDNEFTIWDKFDVHAWPTIVILDKNGNVRYTKVGEGLTIKSLWKTL
ncbi:unnamed protein product [Rotaria sp. Silwood1]|nr:unnamed protein product [Rotaria sp. Silwood1]